VHGLAVTLVGGGAVEIARSRKVLLHAETFFVQRPQPELRRDDALLGGDVEPARGLRIVDWAAAPVGEANSDLIGGRRIAGERRQP